MRYSRSVKCYYSNWLTDEKLASVREFIAEAHRVCDWAVQYHDTEIVNGLSKFDLITADKLAQCASWLTARAKKNVFSEAYGLVLGTKRSCTALGKQYKRPRHDPSRIMLSQTNIKINTNPELENFDLLVELYSYDGRGKAVKTAIPLRKNRQFNKWNLKGKLANSILLTDKYIQFTFEMEQAKKEVGSICGIDPGAKHLLTTDAGTHCGSDMWRLLAKLKRKKRLSKGWHRCREEIKEYIDKSCKEIPYCLLRLLVLEDNRKIKHKSKFKGRLNKNIRSVLTGWSISRINSRIEELCEEHGVSLRRVPAYNNSTKCPHCGHCEKGNRRSQDEFVCRECGHRDNADAVGATNALARFALGTYGSEFKQTFLQIHPNYHYL